MADKQITPFQLTDQFTMDNFNQRINEANIALQSVSNPNLLDNWYFGNPVNQRGGYVVPPGVTYYLEDGGTVGQTGSYYTVTSWDGAAGNSTAHFKINGTSYKFDGTQAVRGYAKTFSEGQMYTIDRWMLTSADGSGNVNILIGDDYIEYNGVGNANFSEIIEGKFAGKTVTLTMLVKDATNCMFGIRNVNTWEFFSGNSIPDGSGLVTVTATIPSDYAYDTIRVTISSGASGENVPHSIKVKAAKLELGSQQTLAHQDNGVWVLNEIPNYADTLARCQNVLLPVLPWCCYSGRIDNDGNAFIEIPTPVSMRSGDLPVIVGAKNGLVYHASGLKDVTYSVTSLGANSVTITASGIGVTNQVCSGCFANKVFLSREL